MKFDRLKAANHIYRVFQYGTQQNVSNRASAFIFASHVLLTSFRCSTALYAFFIPTNIDPENCPIPISERLSTPELNGRVNALEGPWLVNALDGQFVQQMSVAELLNCNSCWFVSMGCSIIPLAIAYTTHCCDGSHLFKKVSILPLPKYRKPIAKPAFVQALDIVSSIV